MKNEIRPALAGAQVLIAVILTGLFSVFPSPAPAQTGPNAVYNSSGNCNSQSPCTASTAFIDASVFGSKSTNFCAVINAVLKNPNFTPPLVIDARGLPGNTGTSMTCTASPWNGISSPPPATILLPATGPVNGVVTPIVIPSGWVLPHGTHLIGVADGDVAPTSGAAIYSGTTIQACASGQTGCSSGFSDTMISFCNSACADVSVENLSLDGQGQVNTNVNGIANAHTV